MSKLILLVMFISLNCFGSDWLCTEEASQRTDSAIKACGIGTASTESAARKRAYEAAENEFWNICGVSHDCKDQMISAQPKRTECEERSGLFICHRLVEFRISQVTVTQYKHRQMESPEDKRLRLEGEQVAKDVNAYNAWFNGWFKAQMSN